MGFMGKTFSIFLSAFHIKQWEETIAGYNRHSMKNGKYQILLTNDDGIESPGLWKAAEVLSALGWVTVVAPREQSSGMGRSMPNSADGRIEKKKQHIGSQEWDVYAINGSPAIAVMMAVLSILPTKPDLVVSGINYGENPGTDITISGTVGAAMEGAAFGIPSLAASLQLKNVNAEYLSHSREIDFSTAAHFTRVFSQMLLDRKFPPEVDLLKLDVPFEATPQTEWHLTSLAHKRYFIPVLEEPVDPSQAPIIGSRYDVQPEENATTDIQTLIVRRRVAVTPLTLDMTARLDLGMLEARLKKQ
jgi:5'-nucleotidase